MADFLSKEGYIVVYYDLIGRGFSGSGENQDYGPDGHLDQLRKLIVGLGYIDRKINFIAHSMGGSLITLYTSKYPDNIKSLILLAPAGLMDLKLLYLIRKCTCLQSILKNIFRNQIKSRKSDKTWRSDIYNHKDYMDIEEDIVKKMWLMHDNCNTAFESFFQSLLYFPLTKIDKEVTTVSLIENIKILLIWYRISIIISI